MLNLVRNWCCVRNIFELETDSMTYLRDPDDFHLLQLQCFLLSNINLGSTWSRNICPTIIHSIILLKGIWKKTLKSNISSRVPQKRLLSTKSPGPNILLALVSFDVKGYNEFCVITFQLIEGPFSNSLERKYFNISTNALLIFIWDFIASILGNSLQRFTFSKNEKGFTP